MDWKIIIAIYSYFQTLQSEHLHRAVERLITGFELVDNTEGCGFGNLLGLGLCDFCNFQSDPLRIDPAKLLFVNLTLTSEEGGNFSVTVKTQKDQSATDATDVVSKTLYFDSLKVSFSIDVTEGHKYASLAVKGSTCQLFLKTPKIYYYFVPEQTPLLTVFPASSAPSQLKKKQVVDAQCAPNAGYWEKPTMKIYSNGTFELHGSCECNPGFELNGTSCSGRLIAPLLF